MSSGSLENRPLQRVIRPFVFPAVFQVRTRPPYPTGCAGGGPFPHSLRSWGTKTSGRSLFAFAEELFAQLAQPERVEADEAGGVGLVVDIVLLEGGGGLVVEVVVLGTTPLDPHAP